MSSIEKDTWQVVNSILLKKLLSPPNQELPEGKNYV